jgi:predicted aspartyl protease
LPQTQIRQWGFSKVISSTTNLAQGERNHLIFLKGNVFKWEVLCLLDIGAFQNFITQNNAKRMELQLEELKAPIEVHFTNGVPHPITLPTTNMLLQLGNWKGKVDFFMVSTLGGMECILGIRFITNIHDII